ncbi:MAG: hypothetical protein IJ518_04820 [Clostridia bacterium]|nr:hypothetical protein [Clostridia bacterium]
MERLIFRRGHGSTWGSQFLVELTRDRILRLEGFSREHHGGAMHRRENIPLEPETWQRICAAVEALKPMLRKKRRKIFKGRPTVDGGKWWSLTIVWDEKPIAYQWPCCMEAEMLERLLQEIAYKIL